MDTPSSLESIHLFFVWASPAAGGVGMSERSDEITGEGRNPKIL